MAEPQVFSAGYLILTRSQPTQFLLMKHKNRWDLPKGRLDKGETREVAALRELEEETGIRSSEIETHPTFRFVTSYEINSFKNPKKKKVKELTIFLGWIDTARTIELTEHPDYQWFNWAPPHSIQSTTIDPLLAEVAKLIQL